MAKRTCLICKNNFIGRTGAQYCSASCRQRARRSRGGAKCDTKRVSAVTDNAPAVKRRRGSRAAGVNANVGGGRSAEAVARLAEFDAELSENAEALGQPLRWSAGERVILDLIADTIDRRCELQRLYEATSDDRLRLKFAGELRLIEAALARLVLKIKTEMPGPLSVTSRKAQRAAKARWDHASR